MTPFRFFALEVIVWAVMQVIVIAANAHTFVQAMLIFSAVNMAPAVFNIIGTAVGAATGWYPFRSEEPKPE